MQVFVTITVGFFPLWLWHSFCVCGCCCWAPAPFFCLVCCLLDETQIWPGDLRLFFWWCFIGLDLLLAHDHCEMCWVLYYRCFFMLGPSHWATSAKPEKKKATTSWQPVSKGRHLFFLSNASWLSPGRSTRSVACCIQPIKNSNWACT